ncbi:hypothetical protein V5F49_22210 [Xanthobacter sp. V3C-3]|uniref:hypothetical protein n=1 Tax=Xanthobacter lutulentifluminis TaxID=3119935 RepID=UPI00372B3552
MTTGIRSRGLDGLAQRLAARLLPAAAARAATTAAADLAETITTETGVPAASTEQAGRAQVRIADPALAAARRGGPDTPGDPTLDRILLAFARRR